MKIRRLKKIRITSCDFKVVWDKRTNGCSVNFNELVITIGTFKCDDTQILGNICHELFEILSLEMHVRYKRGDVHDDFIFVFDHRQHHTMMEMFAGLLEQFIH